VFEGLRLPGPPVALVEDRWLVGWGCEAPPTRGGCTGRGLFMAFDAGRERLFLMLLENGEPIYLAPARTGRWPAMLAEAFTGFAPELAKPPIFDQE
jgi:hypothetical protein